MPDGNIIEVIFTLLSYAFTILLDPDYFHTIYTRKSVLVCLCYSDNEIIACKIGYELSDIMYYSWLCTTSSAYRNNGIASALMDMQHKWCREKGYTSIRTKTLDSSIQMKSLNHSYNFSEIRFEQSDLYGIKILSEKSLI